MYHCLFSLLFIKKKKSKIVEATGLYLTEFSKTKEHAIYFEEIKV